MKELNGIYASAKIFTTKNSENAVDDYAIAQIQALLDLEANKGCTFRIMPDVHPGKVGTIGLTQTIREKILPNVVGIDIGCGITLAKLKQKKIEFQKLDKVIRENVPSGFSIRKKPHHFTETFDYTRLYCYRHINETKANQSLGTLGSGNHFIEIDIDEQGYSYLIIHSGSRHLGKEVTEYYLNKGQQILKQKGITIPYPLTYLEGELMEHYLHDLQVVQEFATLNREIILDELCKGMKLKVIDTYSCVHNYVAKINDWDTYLIRKGAISAHKGEPVIIPINMRDGVILGTGLGNADWNYSAPHGAGRILKREDVANHFTVSNFKAEMKNIYSSCITKDTLDEAPFAYRGIDEISEAIKDSVTINQIIRPVYNFKAGSHK